LLYGSSDQPERTPG